MKRPTRRFTVMIVCASVVIAGCIVALVGSPLISNTGIVNTPTESVAKGADEMVLAQIGDVRITSSDVQGYKMHSNIQLELLSQMADNQAIPPTIPEDDQILELLVTDELLIQLANEKGLSATLEQGRQQALEYKQLMEEQSEQVREMQAMLIYTRGVPEEEYWEKVAPKEYQRLITLQNIASTFENQEGFRQELYKQYKLESSATTGIY